MRTNFVLIDYENVQPTALSVIDHAHFRVIVFVGATQTKIAYETAAALQPFGERAHYIKIASNGANALDFHIAFYVGEFAAQEPDAYFHIISKDTGFDPLIQHLKSRQIRVCRSNDIADIPLVKAASAHSLPERLVVILDHLQQRGTAKPRTIMTLTNTISALFQKSIADDMLAAIIRELQNQGSITISDTKVTYHLPTYD